MPALELHEVSKSFGPVRALRGVDVTLAPGEVHALLGENGAGKSTLLHVAYGLVAPDAGAMRRDGRVVRLRSPRDARALGIGMVHQHFTTIDALTVEENVRLATGPRVRPPVLRLLDGIDGRAPVRSLGVAERQRLEIAKALATGARVLLLDEPTALLAPTEVDELLLVVRAFAREGGAVVLVTHKLPEALAGADRVTILRHGSVTFSGTIAGRTPEELAGHMLGHSRPIPELLEEAVTGEHTVAQTRPAGTPLARLGEIPIAAGDLIGVAAVEGNGQRELLRSLAGLAPTRAGTKGPGVLPVAFVPEDRSTEGIISELSVTENLVLGLSADPRWSRGAGLDWKAAERRAAEVLAEYSITAGGPDALAATLSGGNQQKVILARALERGPALLVAENPTRGLDLRATAEVHRRLRGAAASGVAVVVYSTDLDEVLQLASRVLVVHRGVVREAPPGADRRRVGEMMLGL